MYMYLLFYCGFLPINCHLVEMRLLLLLKGQNSLHTFTLSLFLEGNSLLAYIHTTVGIHWCIACIHTILVSRREQLACMQLIGNCEGYHCEMAEDLSIGLEVNGP